MCTSNPACLAYSANNVTFTNFFTGFDVDFTQVGVKTDNSLTVIEKHDVSAKKEIASINHCAAGCRLYRRALSSGNVQAIMWASLLLVKKAS